MLEGFSFFWNNMASMTYLYGAVMVAFSIVVILSPRFDRFTDFGIGLLKIFALACVYIVLNMLMMGIQYACFPSDAMTLFQEKNIFQLLFRHGIVWILTIGYALLFCGYDFRIKLILICTTIISLALCLELVPLLLYSFDHLSHEALTVFVYTVGILFSLFIAHNHMGVFKSVPLYCAILYLLADFLIFCILLTYQIYEIVEFNSATWFAAFVFVASFGIVIFTYLFLYQLCKENEESLELQATLEFDHSEHEMMQITETNLRELREVRHEMRNHLAYISTIVERRDYDRLEEYISNVKEDVDQSARRQIDSGNREIDLILNTEGAKARAHGIPFETFLVVPPQLPYRETDLCSMISNAINNAIEYCVRAEINDNPISVRIYPQNDFLYISVTNALKESEDIEMVLRAETTKSEKQLHGYGRKIIQSIAEKYGGFSSVDVIDGKFYTEIVLPLTPATTG